MYADECTSLLLSFYNKNGIIYQEREKICFKQSTYQYSRKFPRRALYTAQHSEILTFNGDYYEKLQNVACSRFTEV